MLVEGFQPAFAPVFADDYRALQAMSWLFFSEDWNREGGCRVQRAGTADGEPVAVKFFAGVPDAEADCGTNTGDDRVWPLELAIEFDALCRVSALEGFPTVYGRGRFEGRPFIALEWFDGPVLSEVPELLAGLPESEALGAVSAIGRDFFAVLARLDSLKRPMAHGDISLRNAMIDTRGLSFGKQLVRGSFALRLVDFGLASVEGDRGVVQAPRQRRRCQGTLAYSAPELLSFADEDAVGAKSSPAADVYAAARTILALADATAPEESFSGASAPASLPLRRAQLERLLETCFALAPEARPSAREMANGLAALCEGDSTGRDAR